jgi:hypothetical protein
MAVDRLPILTKTLLWGLDSLVISMSYNGLAALVIVHMGYPLL